MKGHEISGWTALIFIAWVVTLAIAVAFGKWLQRQNDKTAEYRNWRARNDRANREFWPGGRP